MSLRVLHIGKFYPPYRGGMEVFLADLLSEQRRQGIDAHALVHGDPEDDDPEWIERVPVQFNLVYAPMAAGFRGALGRAIERLRPDVLHLHLPNNSALWVLTLPSARKIPWVIHWHSDVVVSNIKLSVALAYMLYRPFEQALLERAQEVFATSPPYLNESTALRPWRNKCSVVPLGINLSAPMHPAALTEALRWRADTKLKLLSIGRLTYYKGFETLINAVSAMPGVELLIVGDGELKEPLQSLIQTTRRQGQPPSTRLVGAVSDAEKHALLEECDVFCLASRERTEAFGVVLLEAMQHARPCIVTDLPGSGMPWVVSQAKNGLLVPFEDVAAWRTAIARLQHDAALRVRTGTSGLKALQSHFGIAPCERAMNRHYRALAPDSSAAPLHDGIMIVVSTCNHEQQITTLVNRIHELLPHADVLVVDNRSTDATSHHAELAGATVLRPLLAMTSWGCLQTGLRYAKSHGFCTVVTIDMDTLYEVEELLTLIAGATRNRQAQLIVAYFSSRNSWIRRMAWQWYRMLTGLKLRDFVSSFRVYKAQAIETAISTEATLLDYQDIGTLMLMHHRGLEIKEVELAQHTTKTDRSGIFRSWFQATRYMLASSLLGLAYRRTK
jgi:glycosyltransferase involved in cell wall biosynthesis